jgi:hypothetical protein
MKKTRAYVAPITPEAFVAKLEAESKPAGLLWQFRYHPAGTVFRRVRGNRFVLRALWQTHMMNSFEPVFRGTFEPCESGTLVRGRLEPHRGIPTFFRVFVAFCLGFMGLGVWAIFREAMSREPFDWDVLMLPVVAIVLLVFLFALRRAGLEIGETQAKMLMEFLDRRLGLVECD